MSGWWQMSPKKPKQSRHISIWMLKIFAVTLLLAAAFSVAAEFIIGELPLYAAVIIIALIVAVGIIFDIMGIAVAMADKAPFFAMASKKMRGSLQSLMLLQKAKEFSNFCCDVVGDITGIVSGAAGATIVVKIVIDADSIEKKWIAIAVSAVIAAVTVAGKALGKHFALKKDKEIVLFMGKALNILGIKGS